MEARSLNYIAQACGGELVRGSPETLVRRVCTDARQAKAGDLFFAITGERFDGHDFIGEVAAKGAGCVVARSQYSPESRVGSPESRVRKAETGTGVILVEDTRQALGRLAAAYRDEFDLPIVAVAGSNGKTTTKELLAAVLRQKFSTLW